MKNIRDNKGIVRTWSDSSHTCIDFQMKKLPSCHLHQGMPLSKPSPDLYQGTPLSRPCPLLGWGLSSLRKRGLPASGVHLHLPPCLPHTHSPSLMPVWSQEMSQSLSLLQGWKVADSFLSPLGDYLMRYTPKLTYSGNELKTSPQPGGGGAGL